MAQRARPVVGIRDVAAAAGVSVTTVSHALNGKGRLPPETRERVRGVADRLGYRPNPAARGLAGGRTGLLGLVVSQAAGLPVVLSDFAYFGQLMAGATSAAIERDHAVVLAPPDHDIAGLQLDGAIVVDPVAHDPVVARLRETGRPVVTTGRVLGEDAGAPWVDNDHAAGTLGMLEHLRRHGARTVALVAGPPVHSYDEDVESAYRAWCAR
jgi:DNA-binding LacI/PurR family transcriptional regulator